MLERKIWASFQRIIELFTQKFVTKLQKICGWDPEKTYPGSGSMVKKAPDPGSGSATLVVTELFSRIRILMKSLKSL
jgi:hypothetical protein